MTAAHTFRIRSFTVTCGSRTEARFDIETTDGRLVADRLPRGELLKSLVRRGLSIEDARDLLAAATPQS